MSRSNLALGLLGLAVLAGCASQTPVGEATVATPVPPVLASQTPGYGAPAQHAAAVPVAPAPKPTLAQVEADLANAAHAQGVQVASLPEGGLLLRASGDVAFASGKTQLSPRFKGFVQDVARQLAAHPGLKASISGHTDSLGSTKGNERLSAARARAVQHELQAQGVAAQRLAAEGRGAREPVAGNDSVEGRAANRRVDIVLSGD